MGQATYNIQVYYIFTLYTTGIYFEVYMSCSNTSEFLLFLHRYVYQNCKSLLFKTKRVPKILGVQICANKHRIIYK